MQHVFGISILLEVFTQESGSSLERPCPMFASPRRYRQSGKLSLHNDGSDRTDTLRRSHAYTFPAWLNNLRYTDDIASLAPSVSASQ